MAQPTTQKRSQQDETADTSQENSTEDEDLRTSPSSEIGVENPDSKESLVNRTETPPLMPQYSYSREELLDISQTPLAKERPVCLDPSFDNACGLWDPERWFLGKRRAESPLVDDPKAKRDRLSDGDTFKRRTSDPKERLKEEQDNIILSPQRRSFGTGCHVTQQSSSNNRRPESPADARGDRDAHREPGRRIGSGRIITRDRDGRQEREFSFRSSDRRERDRFEREEREPRFASRTSNREFGERKGGGRGRQRRMEEEEEPEWFSSGPTSQSETIELRGFDDIPEEDADEHAETEREETEPKGKRRRRSASWRKNKPMLEGDGIPEEDEKEGDDDSKENKQSRSSSRPSSAASQGAPRDGTDFIEFHMNKAPDQRDVFDVNKLFEMDSMPSFLPNGTPPEASRGSRFSQWFRSDSPKLIGSGGNSRRSSLQDEFVGNLINDLPEPTIMIPSPRTGNEIFFEPISPAQRSEQSKNILDMLHSAPVEPYQEMDNSALKDLGMTGHGCSVQELEAGLKQLVLGNQMQSANSNTMANGQDKSSTRHQDEEMPAFKKLLAQISEGQVATVQQGNSLGPIDKNRVRQDQDVVQQLMGKQMAAASATAQAHDNTHHSPMNFPPNKNQNMMNILKNAPTEQDILAGHVKGQLPPHSQPPLQHPHLPPPTSQNAGYPDLLLRFMQQQPPPSQPPPPQPPTSTSQDNPLAKLLQGASGPMRPVSPNVSELLGKRPLNHQQDIPTYHQGVSNGHLSRQQAVQQQQQMQTKALQQQHREILASIAKQQQQQQQQLHQAAAVVAGSQLQQPTIIQQPASPPTNLLHGMNRNLSPRPSSPHSAVDSLQQALFQQQQQARIPSPLVFGQTPPLLSHAPSPIHPASVAPPSMAPLGAPLNPNTLQVYNPAQMLQQRVPSPQELVLHTQQIMQNALLKSKLEEQKENWRKRQEMQRTRSPSLSSNNKMVVEGSPSKVSGVSPTMAAFTPTSVMRKMQAEKDKEGPKVEGQMPVTTASNKFHVPSEGKPLLPMQLKGQQHLGNGMADVGDKTPRPLHGQGIMHSQVPMRGGGPSCPPSGQQGRAIVKGNQSIDSANKGGTGVQSSKGGNSMGNVNLQGKTFSGGSANNFDMNKLLEHQRLVQATQRHLNTSPMSGVPPVTNFPVRGGGSLHPNVARSNMNIPPPTNLMLRNVHPNVSPAAIRAQLSQLAMFQHQLPATAASRLHPVALQQLLLGATSGAPRSHGPPNINVHGIPTNMASAKGAEMQPPQPQQQQQQFGNLATAPNNNNHLMASSVGGLSGTGGGLNARQSPINLAKWFGSDVLKQTLPNLPPVPTQTALSLEEVERRQQQAAVHN